MLSKSCWVVVYVVVVNCPCKLRLRVFLSESKPDRLFIEPTGLGHPAQLLEQLTEPHWQNSLAMRDWWWLWMAAVCMTKTGCSRTYIPIS